MNSRFYREWLDDNGVLLAHQPNIYREKFEAYYGKSASQIPELSRFKIRIEALFPVFIATTIFALCWAVILPDTQTTTHLSGAWDVLKYGFLGSYTFVTAMLIRRFFQRDLRPGDYVKAVLRIVLVLLIAAVLSQVVDADHGCDRPCRTDGRLPHRLVSPRRPAVPPADDIAGAAPGRTVGHLGLFPQPAGRAQPVA